MKLTPWQWFLLDISEWPGFRVLLEGWRREMIAKMFPMLFDFQSGVHSGECGRSGYSDSDPNRWSGPSGDSGCGCSGAIDYVVGISKCSGEVDRKTCKDKVFGWFSDFPGERLFDLTVWATDMDEVRYSAVAREKPWDEKPYWTKHSVVADTEDEAWRLLWEEIEKGRDAEKWLKAVNGCVFIAAVHHCGISDFDWVVERKGGKNDNV